jgi:hypothetical protein
MNFDSPVLPPSRRPSLRFYHAVRTTHRGVRCTLRSPGRFGRGGGEFAQGHGSLKPAATEVTELTIGAAASFLAVLSCAASASAQNSTRGRGGTRSCGLRRDRPRARVVEAVSGCGEWRSQARSESVYGQRQPPLPLVGEGWGNRMGNSPAGTGSNRLQLADAPTSRPTHAGFRVGRARIQPPSRGLDKSHRLPSDERRETLLK